MGDMTTTLKHLLPTLLDSLSPDRLFLLFDLYRAVRRWLERYNQEGMYEILEYDSTMELKGRGEVAIFKRRQRIKFLQDYIIAFQDYAWGEGDILEDYKCSPGVEVDRYREGEQWNILISLRGTANKGDVTDFYTERKIKQGFTKNEEWWQVNIRHHTHQFKLDIIFPKRRRCQQAFLTQRSKHHTNLLGPDYFTRLPDGRQVLTWKTHKLKRFETYMIKWTW